MGQKKTNLRRFVLRFTLRYHRMEKSVQRFTGGSVFRLLTIALLGFLLYQTVIIVNAVREISVPAQITTSTFAAPTADIVHEGEWITVAGSAPGFGVAVLVTDGVERDTCTVSEGRYSFTFQTDGHIKSIQVQVYGDGLPALYTRALPIPEPPKADGKAPEEPDSPVADELEAVHPAPTAPPPEPVRTVRARHHVSGFVKDDLSRGFPETGVVAITFDGGSYSNAAGRILDVLASRNLRATFFLTGEFIKRYPQVTRRIAEAGHEVGNHMYSHLHLTTYEKNYRQDTLPGVTRELVQEELLRNERLFEQITGKKMVKLWRAPFGEQNETIRLWALQAGYRHVSWTYDPKTRKSLDGLDWVSDRGSALYLSSEAIVEKILSFDTETDMGLAGGIVLLHLGSERYHDPFYPKLGELIDRLQERGYRIGSVSQTLEAGG